MCNLCVKDAIAIDTVLVDKGGAVFAKVVEDLYNMAARQNLLQVARETVIEWINSHHIEHVAMFLEA